MAGKSAASRAAVANLGRLLGDHPGRFTLQVIDVLLDPGAAERSGILATPTLVRGEPAPLRIVGDLGDAARLSALLDPSPGWVDQDVETGEAWKQVRR